VALGFWVVRERFWSGGLFANEGGESWGLRSWSEGIGVCLEHDGLFSASLLQIWVHCLSTRKYRSRSPFTLAVVYVTFVADGDNMLSLPALSLIVIPLLHV
jgi:hypothetical protein